MAKLKEIHSMWLNCENVKSMLCDPVYRFADRAQWVNGAFPITAM